MSYEKFLKKVAHELISTYKEVLPSSLIVVPNKRARTFLFEYMRESIQIPLVAPRCFSSEELAKNLAGMEKEENLPLLFELYEAYESTYRKKQLAPLAFEDFYFLGRTLLADFNEIDRYLVDVSQLFSHLCKLEAYEKGAPTIAPAFSRLWENLAEIYQTFQDRCKKNKRGYPGLFYRLAAETLPPNPLVRDGLVFWVGFHALSPAEEKIFLKTRQDGQAKVFLDIDTYFTDNPLQEAGHFYRNFWEKHLGLELESQKENLLSHHSLREIKIFATTNETSMVKLLGEELHKKTSQEENPSTLSQKPDTLAIILPREELLFSVLNAIPPEIKSVNVTMGFPLRASQIASWIENLLSLRESIIIDETTKIPTISGKILSEILDHQYTRLLVSNEIINTIIKTIREKNLARLFIQSLPFENFPSSLVTWITAPSLTGKETILTLFAIVKNLLDAYRKKHLALDSEFIYTALQSLENIRQLIEEKKFQLSFEATSRIIRDVLQEAIIAFSGEPLEGWQIMGFLETQALDFDEVYILSMNEGILPASGARISFLPPDIKKAYNLPLPHESENVYAYHFYRLLKRARKVSLFYTREAGENQQQEKSRYIEQLLFEYLSPKNTCHEIAYAYPFVRPSWPKPSYAKTSSVLDKLRSMSYSPTSLITYFKCSLWFYYKYLLEIPEAENLEEDPDAKTKGNIIHEVMENIFHKGKIFFPQDLASLLQTNEIESFITQAIKNQFTERPLKGKITLLQHIITQQTKKILEKHTTITPFQILETEYSLASTCTLDDGTTIKLKGRIDRIDQRNNAIFIMDYKTGEAGSLSLPSNEQREYVLSSLFQEKTRSQLFQLLFYGYLFTQNPAPLLPSLSPENLFFSICAFKQGDFKYVESKSPSEGKLSYEKLRKPFERGLKKALQLILSEAPFQQTQDISTCEKCPFRHICGREKL
ncbi:PD-(D/E)XK nuclease family protein [Thermospira aquatica]|uniref:PD-(D/E)XK nuclease family protein n=1 Tax=Thermospira aquatica TaxID=2828656 RepID=A0AAX3BHP3_9SPIR|nr:PD-(D/E)XK nuclease family protein [Thermospira aquatica]URA10936.1 PD-(D/E)XK nuclease family protein [Thermospira aquatica]